MKTSGSIWGKIVAILRATVAGWVIALVLQVVWSALLVANLRLTPAVPWAAPTILVIVWCAWNFLGGKWGPRKSAEARRQYLRARPVSGGVLGWSLVAGALSIASLCGLWIVMTQLVRIPSMTLPQMENAPLWEVAVMLGAASLIGPFMEQAGIWGYSQVMLERAFRVPVAVLIVSVTFAFGPHPPPDAPLWPKLVFYCLASASFGSLAAITQSILPSLASHIGGDLVFFSLVWIHDGERPLIAESGADTMFWIHVAQAVVFALLAVLAFVQLAKMAARQPNAAP